MRKMNCYLWSFDNRLKSLAARPYMYYSISHPKRNINKCARKFPLERNNKLVNTPIPGPSLLFLFDINSERFDKNTLTHTNTQLRLDRMVCDENRVFWSINEEY